jgi:hypothetical protein
VLGLGSRYGWRSAVQGLSGWGFKRDVRLKTPFLGRLRTAPDHDQGLKLQRAPRRRDGVRRSVLGLERVVFGGGGLEAISQGGE